MKRKFTGLLMCMLLTCMSLFAGCSLVEPNYYNYYNQVVAYVEHKDIGMQYTITKQDLVSAYQSYGYTYEQYYSYTREEALKETLNLLENRVITLATAEEEFGVSKNGTGLTEKEKTYLYESVVDTLQENLTSYYNEIIGNDDSQEESDDITFNGYTKNATLEPDLTIHRVETPDNLLSDFRYEIARDFNNENDFDLIYVNLIDSLTDDNYKKAFENYLRTLKGSEYGMNLSTDTRSIFEREFNRLYEVLYENYILEKYSVSNQNSDSLSSITASRIVNLYTSKVRSSYTQYVIDKDTSYDDNVQSSLNSTYYFKEDNDSTKFFTVANVLFRFTDEQQALYDEYSAAVDDGSGVNYDTLIKNLYSQITPVIREKYEEDGTIVYREAEKSKETADMTINDILSLMQRELSTLQTDGDVNKIGDKINEYIYMYNEDTGMHNADSNYVVGIDSEGNAVSSFVDEFNDAAIALYNGGKAEIGDISGLIKTQYGYHVLIYTGACENLFDGITSSFELSEEAISVLYSTRVNILVDETYFDVLYDEIYTDNYAYFEEANINYLRENYNIYEYNGRYSDLLS